MCSRIETFPQGDEVSEHFSLIDVPSVELEFDQAHEVIIFHLYRSLDLVDHLTIYLERDQVAHLREYLKFYLDRTK
ncbi:hypothetical protein lacNasYZ03_10810 [Lactobacillus nasalidis]|uniref:Uncharacterized protein n=1 Tax=Lactobacillus nasalidis TaxID=2797258 RepID=A0ABQ3W7S9_9LACO|nr:hypothetical protein lacNasYZ01_03290 [Lactobacillus nasalidis]GHV99134.1 hypothetical protein lacNasYZ02_05640 [Lactobacillus nasalidis]GHW01394.1 hypothetical protein lacNasYZ03_10810 [Lactobacillus nasalidis]